MRRSISIFLSILFFIMVLNCNLAARLGDCNGDGCTNVSDAVMLINYMYNSSGELVDYINCDCDGMPGLLFSDAEQIIEHVFHNGKLYPSPNQEIIR